MPVIMNPVPYCDCISICKLTCENLRSVVSSYRATCSGMIAQLTSADYVMLLTSKTTTVGRTIYLEMSPQIFPAGISNHISRKHFTIAYDSEGNFTLQCLSKNGIMIDETFHSRREQPYILPQHCVFRFPSTTDVIHFKSLIQETTIVPVGDESSNYNCHSNDYSQVGTTSSTNLVPWITNEEIVTHTNCAERPPYSYSQLIVQAISASPQKKLPLCKIYSFIMEKYPYYRKFAIKSWQNSIRHNLSMKAYFLKTPQPEPNIGHLWMVRPSCEAHLLGRRYLTRRINSQPKKISEMPKSEF